jgi:hypothetical protein
MCNFIFYVAEDEAVHQSGSTTMAFKYVSIILNSYLALVACSKLANDTAARESHGHFLTTASSNEGTRPTYFKDS